MSAEEAQTVHDLAAAYAVDAVEASEREDFEAHLPTCVPCQELVSELREATVHLSEGLELAPPADLRVAVLAQVAAEDRATRSAETGRPPLTKDEREDGTVALPLHGRHRRGQATSAGRRPGRRSSWLVAAAAAVVVGAIVVATQVLGPDEVDLVLQADDAREHTLVDDQGQLTVVTSQERDAAALQLPSSMPAPEAGTVYQAWFVSADGSARSAGVLDDEAFDELRVLLEGSPGGAAAVGLSVEPPGGSAQPTTEPFAVVPLG